MNEQGESLAARRLPEGLEGMTALHELLAEHAPELAEVVVGIETDRGPWVAALLGAGYRVYAINPRAASRYRERHQVGGGKSDSGDARMLANLVRTDRHNHRPVAGDSAAASAVQVRGRAQQQLVWNRTRESNRLGNALLQYFPGALSAFPDLTHPDALSVVDVRDHRIILHEVMTNVEEDDGGQRERGRVGAAPQASSGGVIWTSCAKPWRCSPRR